MVARALFSTSGAGMYRLFSGAENSNGGIGRIKSSVIRHVLFFIIFSNFKLAQCELWNYAVFYWQRFTFNALETIRYVLTKFLQPRQLSEKSN